MDHTPAVAAGDERALRLLERADVPEVHRERLFAIVRHAQAAAREAREEMQAEFGPEHVGLIAYHNQFLRIFRGGPSPGVVELWLDEPAKQALRAAAFELAPPEGAIFRMFGWVRIDPMQGALEPLLAAVDAAFRRAATAKKK